MLRIVLCFVAFAVVSVDTCGVKLVGNKISVAPGHPFWGEMGESYLTKADLEEQAKKDSRSVHLIVKLACDREEQRTREKYAKYGAGGGGVVAVGGAAVAYKRGRKKRDGEKDVETGVKDTKAKIKDAARGAAREASKLLEEIPPI